MSRMKITTKKVSLLGGMVALSMAINAAGTTVELFDWAVDSGGNLYRPDGIPLPSYIDTSAFNFTTGLGSLEASISGVGTHYFGFYVDHEIDQDVNTFFNEYGTPPSSSVARLSWEIDEPGFTYGDIWDNFTGRSLDNANGVPQVAPDDVSMALAWRFTLNAGETAHVSMLLGTTKPGGFYLAQTDPDSSSSIYFSSGININGVPESGNTLACLALGLLALESMRRKLLAGV